MTDYTATELMAAKIAILRGRVELSITNHAGDNMMCAIINAVTSEQFPNGVRFSPSLEDMHEVMVQAKAWAREALDSIDDDAAIERIEADRAAQAGPSLGVVDRIAERVA